MLGYSDPQGDFYVQDSGRIVHLEHQAIRSLQPAANSLAYISNSGELIYYAGHQRRELDISNPAFFKNTDKYLYYSNGGNFSVYNGIERKYLGYIQQSPYAFGDSIAAMHDYADYFYVYTDDQFIELEKNPALKVFAGDNIIAYINHLGQFRIFYQYDITDADDYVPIKIECGANTVAYIDNYQDLKVFYKGQIYTLFNLPATNCLEATGTGGTSGIDAYCDAAVVTNVESGLSVFKAGDDMVAYIDDNDRFQVFYDGRIIMLEQEAPLIYEMVDNVLWYIDNNNYFKVFTGGELTVVETYYPSIIKCDKDVVVYTDLDKRLKAFYKGDKKIISDTIVLGFDVNNTMIMYTNIPNKYKFYSLE